MRKVVNKKVALAFLPVVIIDIINYLILRTTYGGVDFFGAPFGEQHIYVTFSFIAMVSIIHIITHAVAVTATWLLSRNLAYLKVIFVRAIVLVAIVPGFTFFNGFIFKGIDLASQISNIFVGINIGYVWLPIISYSALIWCYIKQQSKK